MSNQIRFKATIAPIQSAIRITGDGGGMRIQLDIPESELISALSLLALREVVFTVTMEIVRDGDTSIVDYIKLDETD